MEQLILTEENLTTILAALDAAAKLAALDAGDEKEAEGTAAFYTYQGKLDAYNRVIGMATDYTKKIVYDIPSEKHIIDAR